VNPKPFPSYRISPDSTVINNQFLSKDIDKAFQLWNKYPWAVHVPFEVFLNYLLPYKIYREEPADWRSFFMQKYQDTVRIILKELETTDLYKSSNEIYYRILVNEVGQWFSYQDNPVMLAPHSGFNELITTKSGNCYGWSYLNVMILRSLGIPASIDNVPLWGRKNGSHCTEVFRDNEMKKFRTPSGREIKYPPKVFRYAYKIQNGWTDSIKPVIKQAPFVLNFLKHDHWLDVTHEHTKTATVDYPVDTDLDFAYICVCNYGEWIPVYWGKVNDRKACFENMGTELLYRIAVPKGNTYEVISPVFLVDAKGNKTFFRPNQHKKATLHLSALNTGSRLGVEKGKSYSLYYADEKSNWILFGTQQCEKDSLITFEKVPSNTLYQLRDMQEERRLERIFTYESEEQIFW
jgi:hypothetical protein